MDWQEFFKHFALYSALVTLVFGIWLTLRTKHIDARTTSELVVTNKKDYLIFASGLTVGGILMGLCTYGYMRYELNIPGIYYYLYGIALVAQFIVAWVPDVTGIKHLVHWYSAWIMAHLMLPLGILLLTRSEHVYDYHGIIEPATSFTIFGVIIILAMIITETWGSHGNKSNKQVIRAQQFYALLFQFLLLARIYS